MNLNQVIKLSYSVPNGDKLRRACYSYMPYVNNIKLSNTKTKLGEDTLKATLQNPVVAKAVTSKIVSKEKKSKKKPLLTILLKRYPSLSVVINKDNKELLDAIFQEVKDLASVLFEAIRIGYQWLLPILSNLASASIPVIKETGKLIGQGLSETSRLIGKGLSYAYDEGIYIKDAILYGEMEAAFLQRLRQEDKEKLKVVRAIHNALDRNKIASLNLVRTAFEINYKLGTYILNNI
jgi:hypothetical protein